MQAQRIAELLGPFLEAPPEAGLLQNVSAYIHLLVRWNARVNLTAVRQPEQIVTRHFGESLFAARHLFPHMETDTLVSPRESSSPARVADVGSGAGFPGLPIKLWAPDTHITLIESNHKKVAFLREVVRGLALTGADVFAGRAQEFPPAACDVVTLRAVERFEAGLPAAARLVAPGGRLALLIGQAQAAPLPALLPQFAWQHPLPIPLSAARTLVIGCSLLAESSKS